MHLEGLRGLACLLVALSHTLYATNLDPTVVLPEWLRTIEAGGTGVLVFFVLSGYLISWTTVGRCTTAGTRSYLWRRFVRLAPIYYVALALTVAVIWLRGDQGQGRAVVGAFFGLQNFNGYFGFQVPLPMSNGPLWSLNFELLYYGLFLLLWRFHPRLGWVFLPAAVACLLGWFAPRYMPLFLASYATGWLYWAAGWWLASLPEEAEPTPRQPLASWLLLLFAGHQIEGVKRILNALHWHSIDSGMVTLGQLAVLPTILLVMAAITRRRLPARPVFIALAWLLCLVPLAGMIWTGELWTHPPWLTGGISVLLAVVALPLRNFAGLKSFAPLGRISYACYVVHFPLLFVVQRLPLPGGTTAAYLLRMLVWAALTVALAWFLELRFQPWIKARLRQPQFS